MNVNMTGFKMRQDALVILIRALDEVKAERLFKKAVSLSGDELRINNTVIDLSQFQRIVVFGAGKSTAAMALAAEDILTDRLFGGIISVKYGHTLQLQKVKCFEAGHPIPDDASIASTQQIIDMLDELDENDLALFLVSGGGSSLLEMPVQGLSIQDLQETNRILLACGAEIEEINVVRKHLSRVKGGQLLKHAHPATVITLAVSDVIGDSYDTIASGPTVPDGSTFADAWRIIKNYSLDRRFPSAVLEHLRGGVEGGISENPKPGDTMFRTAHYEIIGNNRMLLEAAQKAAEDLGYRTIILTSQMQGDASHMGRVMAALIRKIRERSNRNGEAICLLAGGETTVVLEGGGTGGRNQELALAAAVKLDGTKHAILLSAGTDGTDGPTDAAGAVVDGNTISRGIEKNLEANEFLRRHDSYNYFKLTEDLIITGPTGTNVMDIVICLVA